MDNVKACCEKCGREVDVDIINVDYNDPECFMKMTCKCKECGEVIIIKVNVN